jgi:transposase
VETPELGNEDGVMSKKYQAPTTRRYSAEFKERAVRMVRQLREETGERKGTVGRVADQLGCGVESLRSWVKQDEIDRSETGGVSSVEAERIKELERENRELRRANAILKSASAFFAAELDRPQQ